MSKRKVPMTIDEHRELGNRLKVIRADYMKTLLRLQEAYPQQSRCVLALRRTLKQLELLRNALDDDIAYEYPREFTPNYYYGEVDADLSPMD